MDEPTAALGPAETAQVRDLISQLKNEGHRHLPHQPRHPRRVRPVRRISVMYHGRIVDTVAKRGLTHRRRAGHDHPGQEAGRGVQRGAGRAADLSLSSLGTGSRQQGGVEVAIAGVRLGIGRYVRPGLRDAGRPSPAAVAASTFGTSPRRPPPTVRRRRLRPSDVLTVAISVPSTSARIWRHSGLAVPPPDARICAGAGIPAAIIRSSPSRSPNATPSSTARVMWRRSCVTVRPTNAPRASGFGCGLRSPVRYGRKKRPSLPSWHPVGGRHEIAEALVRRQRVTQPAQAARRRQHHRHHVPAPRHRVAEGMDAPFGLERAVGPWIAKIDPRRAERQRHRPRGHCPDPDRRSLPGPRRRRRPACPAAGRWRLPRQR